MLYPTKRINKLPMGINRMGSELEMFTRHATKGRHNLFRETAPEMKALNFFSEGLASEIELNFASQFNKLDKGVYGAAATLLRILDYASEGLFVHPEDSDNDSGFEDCRQNQDELEDDIGQYWDNCNLRSLSAYAEIVHDLRKKGRGAMFMVSILMELLGRLRDLKNGTDHFVRSLERLDNSVYPKLFTSSNETPGKALYTSSPEFYDNLPPIRKRARKQIREVKKKLKKLPRDGSCPEVLYILIRFLGYMRCISALKREYSIYLQDTTFDYGYEEELDNAIREEFEDIEIGIEKMGFHLLKKWEGRRILKPLARPEAN